MVHITCALILLVRTVPSGDLTEAMDGKCRPAIKIGREDIGEN